MPKITRTPWLPEEHDVLCAAAYKQSPNKKIYKVSAQEIFDQNICFDRYGISRSASSIGNELLRIKKGITLTAKDYEPNSTKAKRYSEYRRAARKAGFNFDGPVNITNKDIATLTSGDRDNHYKDDPIKQTRTSVCVKMDRKQKSPRQFVLKYVKHKLIVEKGYGEFWLRTNRSLHLSMYKTIENDCMDRFNYRIFREDINKLLKEGDNLFSKEPERKLRKAQPLPSTKPSTIKKPIAIKKPITTDEEKLGFLCANPTQMNDLPPRYGWSGEKRKDVVLSLGNINYSLAKKQRNLIRGVYADAIKK